MNCQLLSIRAVKPSSSSAIQKTIIIKNVSVCAILNSYYGLLDGLEYIHGDPLPIYAPLRAPLKLPLGGRFVELKPGVLVLFGLT